MGKKKRELVPCVIYVRQPDGSAKLWEELTVEEQEAWRLRMERRLSIVMSEYYTQHPDEYAKMESDREVTEEDIKRYRPDLVGKIKL